MTAAAHQPEPSRPESSRPARWAGAEAAAAQFASPAAIRAALLEEETADFDVAYRDALSAARVTLSLDQLHTTLDQWRQIALMTQMDPEGHRRMLTRAAEIRRTGTPAPESVPWSQLQAELGL